MKPLELRSVWISDVHLGLRACKAEYLLDFLCNVRAENLYLVGDIIDFWSLRSGWYWPAMHSRVVRVVLDRARNGTRVVYVPGNHDELFRDYAGALFGGVELCSEAIHRTADGRTFLVIHGDEFDYVVKHNRWVALIGSGAYEVLLSANRWLNAVRRRLGLPYWSLAAYLKHKVKNAVNYISHFEHTLVHEARKRKLDGVICGHIHKAAIERIEGIVYCNDGDWVESCTALVEHPNGRLEIVHWADESALLLAEDDEQRPARSPIPVA
jgi:UDP-2,3-diacylglucosamine pyrophosphatase LpxH